MSILILEATLSYLRINSIWPKNGQDLNLDNWYYMKFVLMILSTLVILVGSTLHLIVSVQYDSYDITEDLVMIIAEIGVYYFMAIYVSYQKKISAIYIDLSDFDKFGKPEHFDERNKRLIFLSRVYKGFINLALVNFCILPLLFKGSCDKHNEERDLKEMCGLVVAAWVPFTMNNFALKLIFYVWQCYALTFSLKGAAMISYAMMESMEHLIVRIQHFKVLLTEAVNTEDSEMRQKLFSKCIQYHIEIFDIGSRIDKYYTGCLFLHILLSGALFGCIGYRFMENATDSLNGLFLFTGWLLSLYIVSISGQHLINETMSVGDIAYNSKWYERDVNFQRNIVIIILRSQRPIVVHAGPFTYVSHAIILSILKTAYSYMTLLKATSM